MNHRAYVLASVLACSALPGAAQSQDSVRAELAGIRASLDQIVYLMQERLEREERSLLLRRIEIKNDRLVPVEKSIRDATEHRRHLEAEEERLRMYLDELERKLFDDDTTPEAAQARHERDQVEKGLERIDGELYAVEQQLQDLDVERRDLNDEIVSLESELDRISRPRSRER